MIVKIHSNPRYSTNLWYWWSYIWATSMPCLLGDRADSLSSYPFLTDGGDPALCVSLLLTTIYSPEREDSTSPHRHTEMWIPACCLPHSALAACRLLPVLHGGAAPSAHRRASMLVGWLPTVTNQGWTAAFFTLRSHCFHFLASFMLPFWGLTPLVLSFFLVAWLLFKPDDSHLPLKRPFRKVEPWDHPHAHT